jgi:hypothetical protein
MKWYMLFGRILSMLYGFYYFYSIDRLNICGSRTEESSGTSCRHLRRRQRRLEQVSIKLCKNTKICEIAELN